MLVLAGCGGSGSDQVRTVRQTRVEVIKGLGAKGAFDPANLYRAEAPGVVTVVSLFDQGASPSLLGRGGPQAGQGSGFVVSRSGEVATNAHVVTSGKNATRRAKTVFVKFSDGNQVPAKIVGTDANSDIALLKIDPSGLRLRPLPLGRSAGLQVGAPVAAIGSPFGEEQSLSIGVVSGTDRTIDSLNGSFQISGAVQTDAAINRGNSGGPLVDEHGRVVGINSQIQSTGGGGEGVGFAVPVDAVRRSLGQLRSHGKVSYAYLGVSTVAVFPQLAKRFSLPASHGSLVQSVETGGPAAKAGLKAGSRHEKFFAQEYAIGGDLITAVQGRQIRHDSDLGAALEHLAPGDQVSLDVYRQGARKTMKVTLGERPVGAGRP